MRKLNDLTYFDSNDTSQFNVVCYIDKIEMFDKIIEDLECSTITELPQKQHFKLDYDALLMKKGKTQQPSKCLSCLTFLTNYFGSLKKTRV